MTNPVSWRVGRKGWILLLLLFLSFFFAITQLQFAGGQNAGGGAFAEEVQASGFTVQRDRAASKAKRAPLSQSHFIWWISAWLLTVTASSSSCLPEHGSPSPTNDRMSFPLPKCKDQKDKAYAHQPKSVPPWRILKKKREKKGGGTIKTLLSSFPFSGNHFHTFFFLKLFECICGSWSSSNKSSENNSQVFQNLHSKSSEPVQFLCVSSINCVFKGRENL